MRRPTSSLHPPFVRLVVSTVVPLCVGSRIRLRTAVEVITPPPQGPRLSPGYSVPNRHHLFGPIRPTRGHIEISPHGGLYAMPSLCGSAEATPSGYSGSQLLRPVRLLAPSTDLTGLPANGGFYFQAFSGSVALPAAGYDYNSVWTPLLAGLSPAGMAASLAALVRP